MLFAGIILEISLRDEEIPTFERAVAVGPDMQNQMLRMRERAAVFIRRYGLRILVLVKCAIWTRAVIKGYNFIMDEFKGKNNK